MTGAPQADALLELAARVEAATWPDRELDAAISTVVEGDDWSGINPHWMTGEELPFYTASLDSAMTLVPEGWGISAYLSENGKHPCVKLGRSHPVNATVAQEGHTLPLTVCAAALRARAHTLQEEGKP